MVGKKNSCCITSALTGDADVASVSKIACFNFLTVNKLIIPAPVMRWVVMCKFKHQLFLTI